jgi:hypothetical protein
MVRSARLRLAGTVSTVLVLAVTAACAGPAPEPAPGPPPTASAPAPGYTLEQPVHRSPVAIEWHDPSRSFFVGTYHDGTIYRGRLEDPTVPVYIEGRRGQTANGIKVANGRLYVAGGLYGDVRVHDLETRELVGRFDTGSGGWLVDMAVTGAGDVWVTDATRPVLWHLTPEQVAAGSGTPSALPLTPEISYIPTPDNVYGIVAVSDRRFIVVKHVDGTLYRIDLDPQAPGGRTISPIEGATVRQGQGMVLQGRRLIVADYAGVSVVELSADTGHATAVAQLRDPPFRATASVVQVGDRYLVANAGGSAPPPDTVSSVPAVG